MSSDDEAQKAIAELNEYQLGGRSLSVNEARPKPATWGSAAANRVVAPSRVGKQVRRPSGDRAPALSLHRVALPCLLSATGARRRSGQPNKYCHRSS